MVSNSLLALAFVLAVLILLTILALYPPLRQAIKEKDKTSLIVLSTASVLPLGIIGYIIYTVILKLWGG